MTECERIISQGKLPEEFFDEEIRNNFKVDKNRKKIWAIEIDLLLELDRVCNKYNLRFFMIYGSLLGAVRDGGFIPWDDDLDVAMPRSDFDKLIDLSKEFQEPYMLQTPVTDSESGFSYIKLRNSNTTAIAKAFAFQNMNHGIFIDINCIDNIDKESVNNDELEINNLIMQNSAYMRLKTPNPSIEDKKRINQWKGRSSVDVFDQIQSICSNNKNKNVSNVGIISATPYTLNKRIFNSDDFDGVIYKQFENIMVPIPKGYDHILTTIYGDYMQYPPEDKRENPHSSVLFDPDVSFKRILPKYREDIVRK